MSNFSKEHRDADVKHFAEKYGADLCNIILKMIEGKDDKDVENLKEKFGAGFLKSIEALITGKLKEEELKRFIAYRGEFYKDIQELVEKRALAKGNIGTPHKKEAIELQKLIELGKKKGFLTYNEINDALPQEGFSVDDMDNLLNILAEMGIEVVDSDEKARASEKLEQEKIITPYKKGDFIGGKYEVYGILGMGGFGIVYLVYSHETKDVDALKTLRDEYLEDREAQERFKKEARIWIDMDIHPFLVRAYFVKEISGRLFIVMEYIAQGEDCLNSLDGYLKHKPPDLAQSLRWAIQFCYGMEYAYSKGIRAHRDIKPANIMIGIDKTLKITDFGIAGVLGQARISGIRIDIRNNTVGFSCQTVEGSGFGTPTHMPPEQFTNAASCDERSDIYSFGIVLYQMATRGSLPFLPNLPKNNSDDEHIRFWHNMHRLHCQAPVPRLNSPLFPIIQRCLEKESKKRYQSFAEIRSELEPLLKRLTGEVVKVPEQRQMEEWEWYNKGLSLSNLGKHQEAIVCFDRAIEINPRYAGAWILKGLVLGNLGKYQEAIICCDRAIEINPREAKTWITKGIALSDIGKPREAIVCYDRAIEINPREAGTWINKGGGLSNLGKHQEAIVCFDRAIEINPRYAGAWYSKGNVLNNLGKYEEAITYYDKAIEIKPRYAEAWHNKGLSLNELGKYQEAIEAYENFVRFAPAHDTTKVAEIKAFIQTLKLKQNKK